jgi:hypothetical protein
MKKTGSEQSKQSKWGWGGWAGIPNQSEQSGARGPVRADHTNIIFVWCNIYSYCCLE